MKTQRSFDSKNSQSSQESSSSEGGTEPEVVTALEAVVQVSLENTIYCKRGNICGALIFMDFALKSVSTDIKTHKFISMTSYTCFKWAELHATQS